MVAFGPEPLGRDGFVQRFLPSLVSTTLWRSCVPPLDASCDR
jgi:hypothetical protein